MKIAIVGAGGFAREVKWLLEDINLHSSLNENFSRVEFFGYVVSDPSRKGPHDSDIAGGLDCLADVDAAVLGIGDPQVRRKLGRELSARFPGLKWPNLIHPTVLYDSSSCIFGKGVIICAQVVATVNVRLGDFCMVNLCCTIGHEAVIGEGSVVNPNVNIAGGVEIGKECLIGSGASLKQYAKVADGVTIGMGAILTKDVPTPQTWVGNPAAPLTKRAVIAD